MADETSAAGFEFLADFAEVVDLAVVNDPVARLGIVHGLMAERREVKNGEAPVAQTDLVALVRATEKDRARIVRATMSQRLRAALEHAGRDLRVPRRDTEDSAHQSWE